MAQTWAELLAMQERQVLDAGSIAYFQEEEEYYDAAEFMLQDSFLNHTAQREGATGHTVMMVVLLELVVNTLGH